MSIPYPQHAGDVETVSPYGIDHAKNFAFILRDGEWRLSPAFDILPGNGMNGYHTSSINDSIIPTNEDVFAVAEKSGLERNKAVAIFDDMNDKIN